MMIKKKPKILVIDDEPSFQVLYQREFGREGWCVVLAGSGKEALEKLRSEMPEIVVLDIVMPGMDGLLTLSQLLEHDNELPVVIFSAFASYRDNFLSWAADEFLIKSSDLTELKHTVGILLESRLKARKSEGPGGAGWMNRSTKVFREKDLAPVPASDMYLG